MPDNKSISQLTTAEQTTSSDLFETSIPNGSLGYLSRKVSLDAIAQFIAKALQYSDLQTEAKTLIGAINEAAQSGGGASIEEMTQAEYNALTPEQKADGTLRAISDATTSINDIDDVNISSVADGDALIYDSTSSKWVNSSDFVDNVCKGRTTVRLTDITSSSVINITRTASLQTYLVIVRGTNSQSYYVGLITGYGGGTPRNAIVELGKGNNIGAVSFLTSDADDFTLSITIASSSISASLNVLVIPYQQDDTFTITKT